MKKKIMMALLAGALAVTATGCTAADNSSTEVSTLEDAGSAEEEAVITEDEDVDVLDEAETMVEEEEGLTEEDTETEEEESGETDPAEKYDGTLPDTSDGILDESMFTSVTVDGTEYAFPLDYEALQDLGYAADEDAVSSTSGFITVRSDNYPYCALDLGTGSSEITEEMLMEEGITQMSFARSYDDVYPDIKFQGIGLGSTADELLEVFGNPNEAQVIGSADIEASYTYERNDGVTDYVLTFYIGTDGEVTQIDYFGAIL